MAELTKMRSLRETAEILARRGIPTTSAYVAVIERRTLAKLRRALELDEELMRALELDTTPGAAADVLGNPSEVET